MSMFARLKKDLEDLLENTNSIILNYPEMSKEVSPGVQYHELLLQLKQHIRSAQAKAALSVNTSLIQLYWNTGKMIAEIRLCLKVEIAM